MVEVPDEKMVVSIGIPHYPTYLRRCGIVCSW